MKRIRLASIVLGMAMLLAGAHAPWASATPNPIFYFDLSFGSYGSGETQLKDPNGVAISGGNVWVTDGEQGKVKKLNSNGELQSQFSVSQPRDIAIDSKGNLWVSSWSASQIKKFNTNGEEIGHIGELGEGNGQLWHPTALTIDSKGNFWVIDYGNNRVQQFNSEGKYVSQFKLNFGSGNGQFYSAEGIAVDASDNLWITDYGTESGRVQKFNSKGEYLTKVGQGYLESGLLGSARFDSGGRLWIADSFNHRVAEFNVKIPSAAPIGEFGKEGTGAGQFSVPNAIGFDEKGRIWVTDGAGRAQRWTAAPTVVTEDPTVWLPEIGYTLRGSVNPNGLETTYQFEYGTTTSYGSVTPPSPESVGGGYSPVKKSEIIGVKPHTTYHYRIVATNGHGTSYGQDKTFHTSEWVIQPSSDPVGATNPALSGVSCTGSDICAAVGNYTTSGKTHALAKVENGSSWALTSAPEPSGTVASNLADVACSASNACTAVGAYSKSGSGSLTLAERWNGSSWAIQTTPNAAGQYSSYLQGAACIASNDCIAVGYSTNEGGTTAATLAEHWNGTTWSIVSTPNVEGFTQSWLSDISCVSSSDCWAVGRSFGGKPEAALAEHWNGTSWSINSPAGLKRLSGVSCASSSSCIATTDSLVLARWNGSSWSQETAPAPADVLKEGSTTWAFLKDVSCASTSACVAVGEYFNKEEVQKPLTLGWNGSSWSVLNPGTPSDASPFGIIFFSGVSCSSATACTAVGRYSAPGTGKTLIEARY